METLLCSKCGEHKSPEEFYKRSDRPRGRQSKCKSCVGNSSKQVREWRAKNPEANAALRQRERVKLYDLSQEDYDALLEEQGNRCAICRDDTPGGKGRWHIDHSHASGKVRGLLCSRCNLGLGYFRDATENLKRAIEYLEVKDGPHD
jgi:hypothetical protein